MTRRRRLRITQKPTTEPPAPDDPALPQLPDPGRRRDEDPPPPGLPQPAVPWTPPPLPPRRRLPS
jgi:hypothetical protein